MSNFSKRLAKIREDRGMSASDVARLLDVTPTAVWNWEKNGVKPRPDMLSSIAKVFGVSEKYLLVGGDEVGTGKNVADILADTQLRLAQATGMVPEKVKVRVEFEAD